MMMMTMRMTMIILLKKMTTTMMTINQVWMLKKNELKRYLMTLLTKISKMRDPFQSTGSTNLHLENPVHLVDKGHHSKCTK